MKKLVTSFVLLFIGFILIPSETVFAQNYSYYPYTPPSKPIMPTPKLIPKVSSISINGVTFYANGRKSSSSQTSVDNSIPVSIRFDRKGTSSAKFYSGTGLVKSVSSRSQISTSLSLNKFSPGGNTLRIKVNSETFYFYVYKPCSTIGSCFTGNCGGKSLVRANRKDGLDCNKRYAGVEEENKSNMHFSLSPNPVRDRLTVTYPEQELVGISLRNSLGQRIKLPILIKEYEETQRIILDTQQLPMGLYYLNIRGTQNSYQANFLKSL